jgi:hypothetical protein
VEVDLVSGVVAEDEVPGAGVVTGNRRIPTLPQGGDGRRRVALLDDDVEVAVTPGSAAQAGVYVCGPALSCPAGIQHPVDAARCSPCVAWGWLGSNA